LSDPVHLSFTVGPVQAFVAQARRTRDLWAGSWLLSYLTECALAAAETAGGTALIPYRAEPKQITAVRGVVGGMPNRFELIFADDEQARRGAAAADAAFRATWTDLADAVWNTFVDPVAARGDDTTAIWRRQIAGFWELSWVIGRPEGGAHSIARLAAARKMLRNVPATVEGGVQCSLMGNLQELSGHTRRKEQRAFWDALRDQAGAHDLKDGERLCAIALIKRFFPSVIEDALGEWAGARDADLDALKKQTGWPSTAFFAALPWLQSLAHGNHTSIANDYASLAKQSKVGRSEIDAAKKARIPELAIDATAWYTTAIDNNEWQLARDEKTSLLSHLRDMYQITKSRPAAHYALLLMDGDSLGSLLQRLGDPQTLSRRLADFTDGVDAIIDKHDGRTIYAGGDDVLAMLPARSALEAADQLAASYLKAFGDEPRATLSGAIVYAPWKFPLRRVLSTAHHLLDDIAKDRSGRDALALGIVQGSGLNAVWSAPWAVIRGSADGAPALSAIVERFGGDDADAERAEFNASFLYHLRQQFTRLLDDVRDEPGRFATTGPELLAQADARDEADLGLLGELAHAEFRRRLSKPERKAQPRDATAGTIRDLMSLSRHWDRDPDRDPPVRPVRETFTFDGWRVARFLKRLADGKGTDHD